MSKWKWKPSEFGDDLYEALMDDDDNIICEPVSCVQNEPGESSGELIEIKPKHAALIENALDMLEALEESLLRLRTYAGVVRATDGSLLARTIVKVQAALDKAKGE